MSGDVIGAIVTILSASIAGWFAYLAKQSLNRSPETVAGGYSSLVGDLRFEMNRLSDRVQHLEEERKLLTNKVEYLTKQLRWLLVNIDDDDRIQFNAHFKHD